MFLMDWQLALFSLALLPVFLYLTRRVGRERRRITTTQQRTLADLSTLVEESLSVSGILLGRTMGRSEELATVSRRSPPTWPGSRCNRGWPAAG